MFLNIYAKLSLWTNTQFLGYYCPGTNQVTITPCGVGYYCPGVNDIIATNCGAGDYYFYIIPGTMKARLFSTIYVVFSTDIVCMMLIYQVIFVQDLLNQHRQVVEKVSEGVRNGSGFIMI